MKMLRYKILCFVIHIFFPLVCISNIIATNLHTVYVSENVLLENCGTSSTKKYWSFDGTVLFFNKMEMDRRFGNTVTVLDNFSLAITSVSLEHEGTYECRHGAVSLRNYSLEVQVLPHLELSIDGKVKQGVYFLEEGKYTSIVCKASGAKPAVNVTFMINDNIINPLETDMEVSVNRHFNQTFDSVGEYRTRIWGVSGNITCFRKGRNFYEEQRVTRYFHTYSVPGVVLTLNGKIVDNITYVDEDDGILAECTVREARPAANITWQIDNREIDINGEDKKIITFNTSMREATGKFDVKSLMQYQPRRVNGTISCITTLGEAGIVQAAEISFYTYVIPDVFLVVNEKDGEDLVNILKGEEITAFCRITGTRPEVGLEWMVNNVKIDHNFGLYNLDFKRYQNNMTSNFTSTLRFLPKGNQGNITCSVKGHPIGTLHVFARYQTNEFNVSTIQTRHELMGSVVIFLIMPISVVLFSIACFFVRRALRVSGQSSITSRNQEGPASGSCGTDVNSSKQSQHQIPSSHIERKESLTSEIEMSAGSVCLSRRFTGCANVLQPPKRITQPGDSVQYQRPPKLELPEVPEEGFDPGYSRIPDGETGYCTFLGERASESRIYYEKDLCLILSMKMGQLYNRWMGTIDTSDGTSKCVVISTVSDTVSKARSISLNEYVKRVLELPDNINLAKVEGICIDSAHLYLLHEHLICGTLDVRVKEKKDKDVSEIISYISGILEGMELLHSYGFLHPGFSCKKILLTKKGVCKIYDFCLSEDAADVVNNKKASKMYYSVNQFAPEALLRSGYTQASDVWSVAVVIWETMTGGCSQSETYNRPYAYDVTERKVRPSLGAKQTNTDKRSPPFCLDGITSSRRISVAPETWPGMYQQLRNDRLLDCWNRDSSCRPTINHLRGSFKELFENLDLQPLSEDILATSDLYVAMTDSKEVES